jgi:hypothetical protein
VPSFTKLGGRGQFSSVISVEVYDCYSVSPEYFGYTLVYRSHSVVYKKYFHKMKQNVLRKYELNIRDPNSVI